MKLLASGEFDDTMAGGACEDFVKRQRKRLGITDPVGLTRKRLWRVA
jgi:hypothetical protein